MSLDGAVAGPRPPPCSAEEHATSSPPTTAPQATTEEATPARHVEVFAHRVTRLIFNSPAHSAGLVPFFDHLVAFDDIKLGSDTQWFAKYAQARIGKVCQGGGGGGGAVMCGSATCAQAISCRMDAQRDTGTGHIPGGTKAGGLP